MDTANKSRIYFQRFDGDWQENVDVENLDEIQNKDKLFLVAECVGEEQKKVFIFLMIVFSASFYWFIT